MLYSSKYLISFFLWCLFKMTFCFACQICVPFQTKTIADKVINANAIVLARESKTTAFRFEAHTVLKGKLLEIDDIDIFLNSSMRKVLKSNQNRNFVLIRTLDGDSQKWETIGMGKPEIEELVYSILNNQDNWNTNPESRLDFFIKYIRHKNRTIREQAYLEIGRLPYSEIRRLKDIVPKEEIYAFLENAQYIEWHALYILLLGLSEEQKDIDFIRNTFENLGKLKIHNRLAAYSTAYLEMKPNEALTSISKTYFADATRNDDELRAVIQALSVHGQSGHTFLRHQIVNQYKILLEHHPHMAAMVVRDLFQWQRWDLVDEINSVLKNPTSSPLSPQIVILRKYINIATDKTKN